MRGVDRHQERGTTGQAIFSQHLQETLGWEPVYDYKQETLRAGWYAGPCQRAGRGASARPSHSTGDNHRRLQRNCACV